MCGKSSVCQSAADVLIALAVNGVLSDLATDGLGSVSAAFDANGNAVASALYRPFGGVRYSSGAMPGSYGFTGQRSDAAVTGLDYYNARYYDPAAGGFTTADSLALDAKGAAQGQTRAVLDRYSYVGDDPETATDPTGHVYCETDDAGRCLGGGKGDKHTGDKTSCKGDPDDSNCYAYEAWEERQRTKRDTALNPLKLKGILEIIGGSISVIVADWLLATHGMVPILDSLEAILDLISTLADDFIPFLGQAVSAAFPQLHDAYEVALSLSSGLHQVVAIVNQAIAAVESFGALAMTLASGAFFLLTHTAAGLPGMLFNIGVGLLGNAFLHEISSGGHQLIAQGFSDYGEWQRQEDMDIGDWCTQYGAGTCASFQ